jgi:hypothetical protein
MDLTEQITKAIEWIEKSLSLIDGVTFDTTNRARVSIALLHLSLEHQRGIVVLTDNEAYGSSLALFRPQFEAYVRGVWFQWCSQEKDIESFLAGKEPEKIGVLIEAVEKLEGYEGAELSRIRQGEIWKSLNDYTHGGVIQVKARNTKDEIAYNYNSKHISNVIKASVALAYSAGVAIAKITNDEKLANALMTLHKQIYSDPNLSVDAGFLSACDAADGGEAKADQEAKTV